MPNEYIWLEVSNVRTEGAENAQVQLKGDRTDKESAWWDIAVNAYEHKVSDTAKEVFRALDSKRTVLAGIGAEDSSKKLVVRRIRIQLSDSGAR